MIYFCWWIYLLLASEKFSPTAHPKLNIIRAKKQSKMMYLKMMMKYSISNFQMWIAEPYKWNNGIERNYEGETTSTNCHKGNLQHTVFSELQSVQVLKLVWHEILRSKFALIEVSVCLSVRCHTEEREQEQFLNLLEFTVADTSILTAVYYYHNWTVEWNK